MLTNETVSKLQNMRMSVMARQFKEQMDDTQYASMSFEDRFGMLVDAEWSARKSNRLRSLIKNAGYAISGASVEDIEYLPDRKLDKSQILRLASCAYIQEAHNVVYLVPPVPARHTSRALWGWQRTEIFTAQSIFVSLICWWRLPWLGVRELTVST